MDKIAKTMLAVISWAVIAFCMSILYYWLKSKGIIWDNPTDPKMDFDWNSRKVIFGIVSLTSFIMLIVSIISIWDKDTKIN